MTQSITIAGITAAPGQKVSGWAKVPGTELSIPVTLINGSRDGKIFLATAGIHGCEYPGIRALAELAQELEPSQIRGAVLLVHVANTSGYFLRQTFVVPADPQRKNLNQMFPTDHSGSPADKICVFLMEEFVRRCDFHVDLHSGDMVEELEPFVLVANIDDPEKKQLMTRAAMRTQFPWRMNSGGKREFYNGSARTYGVPSLLFERGGAGACLPEEVAADKADLCSILQFLEILPGAAAVNSDQQFFDRHEWTEAEPGDEGMLIPFVRLGDDIRQGQKLFAVQDVFGNPIRNIYAKYDGHVVLMSRTLAVHQADDLITYGHIQK